MECTYYDLPDLPLPKLLASDNVRVISGYSAYQLMEYAITAIEDYKRKQTWSWRFRHWLRRWLMKDVA